MQSRRKLLIIVVASILVLLLAGAATLLVRGFLQLQEVDVNLQSASETLTSLYAQNPFPSGGNLRLERENIKSIGEELLGLRLAMAAGQVEPVAQSPAKCITQFWETRNSLLARAGSATKVDRAFDFGFGRHMKGDLPSIQDVPRLTQQLKLVETLCNILYASRVSTLNGLCRQEFESDAGAIVATGRPLAAPSPVRAGDIVIKNTVDATAGVIPAGQLYGRWRFGLHFTARESALMKVLNGFSSSPVFIVVTRLEVAGDEKVFDRKEAEAVAAKSAESSGEVGTKEVVRSRDARVVCGRDAVMNVKLELEVYQFEKPQITSSAKKLEGVK